MLDLETVRTADVMEKDVVLLQALTPLREALETLEDYSIHGAPVVNEAGELVGVFSETDVLRRDTTRTESERESESISRRRRREPEEDRLFTGADDDRPLELDREIVADWMTPRVVALSPSDSLAEACRVMARERIHRVFIVENERVSGVISALDIVSLLGECLSASPSPH